MRKILTSGKYRIITMNNISIKKEEKIINVELLKERMPIIKQELKKVGLHGDYGYCGSFAYSLAKFIAENSNEVVNIICIFNNQEEFSERLPQHCVVEWMKNYWDIRGIISENDLLAYSELLDDDIIQDSVNWEVFGENSDFLFEGIFNKTDSNQIYKIIKKTIFRSD